MITVSEFRQRIAENQTDFLLEEILLAPGAKHVSNQNIQFIRNNIAEKYGVPHESIEICITGSAKLGFSIVEKRWKGEQLARYRSFSAHSDIDVAVISRPLFEIIWMDLSKRAHRTTYLPWDSKKLGDYMMYGWLRPDHFPNDVRVPKCDDWWDLFRRFSSDARYQRRKVRGGLFYSKEQLALYMARSINDCVSAEELSK